MSAPVLSFPEGLHFTCSRCGDCCHDTLIVLGPGEAERIGGLEWKGRVDALVGVSPTERVGSTRRVALAHRSDGACVFLGPESQCLIHEHFGEPAKPLMCRLYPFGLSRAGGRFAVDVSFSCRAVIEDSGAPLEERVRELTRLVGEAKDVPDRHRFSERYQIEGDLLWELEQDVLGLLARRDLSMLDRIRSISEFLRLGTTADPRTGAARKLRQVMVEGIPRQLAGRPLEPEATEMDKTQRAVFFHLLFLMLNPTPVGVAALPAKEREREARLRVQAAELYRNPRARPWLGNRELGASFAEVRAVELGWLGEPPGERLAERFLGAKVLGQRFLREGEKEIPFLDAVPRWLLLYPMLLWSARAAAAEAGRPRASLADVRHAVRQLDRAFGAVPIGDLPSKQRKAWTFVLNETDLAVTASAELGPP